MKSLRRIRINKGNTVLIIVDVQNEFCKPGGKFYSWTSWIVPRVIPNIKKLAELCRSVNIPIIYIQSVRTLEEAEFTVFNQDPHLEIGTWATRIVDELEPKSEDIVVQKYSHDPFYKTELDQVLQTLVSDPTRYYAIVIGGAINICVYHTVMGFYLRDYWTIVPVDCTFYGTESGRRIASRQFSLQSYPNIFLSCSDLIEIANVAEMPVPMADLKT